MNIQENSLLSSTFVALHCHVLPFSKIALDYCTFVLKNHYFKAHFCVPLGLHFQLQIITLGTLSIKM
jgi:hypothetical protein